jgi:hypothetical protein
LSFTSSSSTHQRTNPGSGNRPLEESCIPTEPAPVTLADGWMRS